MMGCDYLYMVHAVLLRVCTQFYCVKELCHICAFCSYYYPHRTVIILRKTHAAVEVHHIVSEAPHLRSIPHPRTGFGGNKSPTR